jgi:hypothetical protein
MWFDNQQFEYSGTDVCTGSGPSTYVWNDFGNCFFGCGPGGGIWDNATVCLTCSNKWAWGDNFLANGVTNVAPGAPLTFMDSTNVQAPATVSFAVKLVFNGTSGTACPCTTPYWSQLTFYAGYDTACPRNNNAGNYVDVQNYFNGSAPDTVGFWIRSNQAPVSFTFGIHDATATSLYTTTLTIPAALTWTHFSLPLVPGSWDANFPSLDWTQVLYLEYNIYE